MLIFLSTRTLTQWQKVVSGFWVLMIRTCRVLLAPGFETCIVGLTWLLTCRPESPGQLKLRVVLWTFIRGLSLWKLRVDTHVRLARARLQRNSENLNQWRKALPSRERADKPEASPAISMRKPRVLCGCEASTEFWAPMGALTGVAVPTPQLIGRRL